MIYFTADLHFGHSNIIKYCKRPFECVGEMNEILIKNWNSVVKPTDTVYVPGDFAMGDPKPYLEWLSGEIYLIPGDHDKVDKWPRNYVLPKICSLYYPPQHVILCHYPILAWPRSHYGSWHLHGHCHEGTLPYVPGKIMNVGVDLNNFYPVSWPEVVEYMKGQPENWNSVVGKKIHPPI
jgi:calcineurin-like phosphoesterase family protein